MKRSIVLLSILCAPLIAAGQQEQHAISQASILYGQCIVHFSTLYAETKELPEDIITGAMGQCLNERNALSSATSVELSKSGLPQPDKLDALLQNSERLMRRAAMRAILEKRYPTIKSK